MNAVAHMVSLLSPDAVRRLAALRRPGAGPAPLRGPPGPRDGDALRSPALRELLWQRGAALERAGSDVSPALQPPPIVLGGHLVVQSPPRGAYPPSAGWPRALPAPRAAAPPLDEP